MINLDQALDSARQLSLSDKEMLIENELTPEK
jgi:hypothetical protein